MLPIASLHRLRRGLQGYLIPFAPHAFVPQRQNQTSRLPSPLVFFSISTDFTPTPKILPAPSGLNLPNILSGSMVKPWNFKQNLGRRLRTLYAQ